MPRAAIPPVVRRLGWVSFFADAAGEMLYPIIPLFLTVTLGAPVAALGLIEGVADGIATGLRAAAGEIADRVRSRRRMVQLGYAVSAIAKPLIALAPGWPAVAGLRAADRAGKAVRGVPRDLIVADATERSERGRVFGYHRMMDTAGAVAGPLAALAALAVLGEGRLRLVFVIALVPGLASLWLLRALPEPQRPAASPQERHRLPRPSPYWRVLAATTVFAAGNSSDTFLLLRARDLGLSTTQVVLAYAFFNAVYASCSMGAGIRADRVGHARVYAGGLVVFAVVYAGFAVAGTAAAVWPLLALYGGYMALTDGVLRALIVSAVPDHVAGRALGTQQAMTGAGVLVAGITAGLLWDHVSPAAPFVLGAVTATLAAGLLVPLARRPAGDHR